VTALERAPWIDSSVDALALASALALAALEPAALDEPLRNRKAARP
jgi:hypothetical protein